MSSIGTVWADGTWADDVWADGTWADAVSPPPPPPPDGNKSSGNVANAPNLKLLDPFAVAVNAGTNILKRRKRKPNA